MILEYIHNRIEGANDSVEITLRDYPLVCARDGQEFGYILEKATELSFLERRGKDRYRLTMDAWKKLPQLKWSNQAFVAMRFDDTLKDAYFKGILPALNAVNYQPYRVDFDQFNDKVCDRIIAGIRKSKPVEQAELRLFALVLTEGVDGERRGLPPADAPWLSSAPGTFGRRNPKKYVMCGQRIL